MYKRIQELKQNGFKKRKAAREAEVSRETVDKYWDMSEEDYLALLSESQNRGSKLDAYRGFISDKLRDWSEITSSQIHDHLTEKLLAEQAAWLPSRRCVQEYVSRLREELGLPTMLKIRQYEAVEELPYGKQAQVDMGVKTMKDVYGKNVKVYIFVMVLSRSRYKFVYFQLRPFNAEDFVSAHDMAFKSG
jgi:transposase